MDPRLQAHRAFLPDQTELARLEMQAAHIRTLQHGRTGEHLPNQSHSHFLGRGLDLEKVRAYSPGDDIRAMDWRVTARTGKPHVKIYREERQRVMVLLVQASGSMLFGSAVTTKLAQAARMAALLAFTVQRRRDRVSVLFSGDLGGVEIPPSSPREAMWRMLDFLSSGDNGSGQPMPWGQRLASMPAGRTVVMVSDFIGWDDDAWQGLRQAAARHRVSAVQVYDPRECAIPDMGLARMSGPEGGVPFLINTGHRRAREAYAACWEAHRQDLFRRLALARAPYWAVSTTDDPSVCVGQMAGLLAH
ncbi:MAG TPA: DUF58 domain-containing protein [Mariprofundaceae bacterium]|nr:DUF58 domain-containing protein [Mariprofundaceae bacterium]